MVTLSTSKQDFIQILKEANACEEALDWVESLEAENVYEIIKAGYKDKNFPKAWARFNITNLDLDEQVARMMGAYVRNEAVILYKSYQKISPTKKKWWKKFIVDKGKLAIAKGKI